MTDNIVVSKTAVSGEFKNPIAVKFFENLDVAAKDFSKNGKLSFPVIEKILGKRPVIPNSPDMDARLEACEELSQYSNLEMNIESKLRTYAERKGA